MKYKIGDKVLIKSLDWYNENKDAYGSVYAGNGFGFFKYMTRHCGEIMKIDVVNVDPEDSNKGYYFMENSEERWTDEMIEGLAEEPITLNGREVMLKLADVELPSGSTTIWDLPNGYIFKDENDNVINATKIVLEKKKNKYPKTYEECYRILNMSREYHTNIGYKWELINNFQKLLICRDAYWKIVGEEMGLGKPWKPDFSDDSPKYNIFRYENEITLSDNNWSNRILAFPTKEIRNAFYENFKELIEQCKELL